MRSVPFTLLLGTVLMVACSDARDEAAQPPPLLDPSQKDGGAASNADAGDAGADGAVRPPTDIAFGASAKFSMRSCAVKLSFAGSALNVKVAGEFTNWESGALPLAQNNGIYEISLPPSASLVSGQLYAYKLIVDGNWILDPKNKYRKILGGMMNSALRMPACDAGPEIVSGLVGGLGSGDVTVKVTLQTAADGDAPKSVSALLDGGPIPDGSWTVDDTQGSVSFAFKGLAKGKHRLALRAVDGKGRAAEPVDLPFWVEDEAFEYRDGVLYMFMIDRFANGEKSIDKPIGTPVDYDADWHGGDLQGALSVLKSGYFEKLGVRTIWLSPLNRQTDAHEKGAGDQWYSGYHGYWPIRAREVDPRFGGEAALRSFIAEAHARGLRVLLDLINNQVYKDHEYVTPHASFFRTTCQCGDDAHGCGWSVRPFDCQFQPYLPDINWQDAGAESQFIADAVNWIDQYDFDGFRVDAVKHVEANAIYNMRAELSRRYEQGGARIFMVGETAVGEGDQGTFFGEHFGNGFEWISAYLGANALDGQFDFPTRHNMADGLVNGLKPLNEVEGELHKAETRYPAINQNVMFLNGHDNPRIASIAAQDPKLGCNWSSGCRGADLPPLAYDDPAVYVKLKRALTVLYTMPRVPYLYAGDELGFGGGADPDMRRDMLFKEGLDAVEMSAPGQSPPALKAAQTDLREWVRKLGATRTASRALRRGNRVPLIGNDGDFWVYAYQGSPGEVALVVINRGGAQQRDVDLSSLSLGSITSWKSALGTGSASQNGSKVTINLGAGEAAIFVP